MGSNPGYLLKSFLLYVHVIKVSNEKDRQKNKSYIYFRKRGLAKIFSPRWQFLQERTTLISMETRLDENHCYTVGLEGD